MICADKMPATRSFKVMCSKDKTIKLWNLKTGELLNTLTGHQDEIYSIKFSPDGNSLVSGSKDKTIKLWLR